MNKPDDEDTGPETLNWDEMDFPPYDDDYEAHWEDDNYEIDGMSD